MSKYRHKPGPKYLAYKARIEAQHKKILDRISSRNCVSILESACLLKGQTLQQEVFFQKIRSISGNSGS